MKLEGLIPNHFENFILNTLIVESESLKKNPTEDPYIRHNLVLCPKKITKDTPVVIYLSGFSGDGWKNFSFNRFESNTSQDIDLWTTESLIPPALYVFVNAWTKWGGSQFINSNGFGNYENYIIHDLIFEIKKQYSEISESKNWIVFGGSSGGYGALHLGTRYPNLFQKIVALAPDSLFEVSLLPEIYKFLPYIQEIGGFSEFEKKYKEGLLKYSHEVLFGILNFVAMTYCYAPVLPSAEENPYFLMPIKDNGDVNEVVWQEWLKHDPVRFLPFRHNEIEKLKSIRIYTGHKDEHGLQYGSRKIVEILKTMNVDFLYQELAGTHRSLGAFRKQALIESLQF